MYLMMAYGGYQKYPVTDVLKTHKKIHKGKREERRRKKKEKR